MPSRHKRAYEAASEQIVLDRLKAGTLFIDIEDGTVLIKKPCGEWAEPFMETDRGGYRSFRLYHQGTRRRVFVHRAVWIAANMRLIPEGHEVHHGNADNETNAHWNLETLPKDAHKLIHAGAYPESWDEDDF